MQTTSRPHVPDAPDIPGLIFRHYNDAPDIVGMLDVHEGCRLKDQTDPFSVCDTLPNLSADEYVKRTRRLLEEGRYENVVIAELAGNIIAHGRLEWWNEHDAAQGVDRRAYLSRGWVLPQWRRQGIGSAILRWAEAHAAKLDQGRHKGELAANASDGEQDAIALLTSEGYHVRFLSPELAFDAFANLPPLATPPGYTILPMCLQDSQAIAHALIEANVDANWDQAALNAWISKEEAGWVDFVEGCDTDISRIAWHGNEVAGLYLCKVTRGSGDVANVAVRHAYRRQGLARALMNHCLYAMREKGLVTSRVYTSIGADRNEPATGPYLMYQRFGFCPIACHNRYRKTM